MKSKKELRKEILQIRDALTLEERSEKSHKIAEKVITQKEFMEANKILLFASYKSEVDTTEILEAAQKLNKDIYYPKVTENEMEFFKIESDVDLTEGYRGIREPKGDTNKKFVSQTNDKIIVIMPGAVFDKERNRVGYGGGYYDKFLQMLNETFYKMAIAFECQMVDTGVISREWYDVKPDCIVTEVGVYGII